jgi:hypothetical protein
MTRESCRPRLPTSTVGSVWTPRRARLQRGGDREDPPHLREDRNMANSASSIFIPAQLQRTEIPGPRGTETEPGNRTSFVASSLKPGHSSSLEQRFPRQAGPVPCGPLPGLSDDQVVAHRGLDGFAQLGISRLGSAQVSIDHLPGVLEPWVVLLAVHPGRGAERRAFNACTASCAADEGLVVAAPK